MNKIAVVYKSKYGTTKKYAQWLAEEVNADLIENLKIDINMLMRYDTIIYGGGLYAGRILGFSLVKNNYEKLKDKNIIVFAVGASIQAEKAVSEVSRNNFSEEMQKKIKLFFLRGGLNYKKLNALDRFLMFMLKKSLEKKKPEEQDEDAKGIIATYGRTVDFTNKKAIEPIVQCQQELMTY